MGRGPSYENNIKPLEIRELFRGGGGGRLEDCTFLVGLCTCVCVRRLRKEPWRVLQSRWVWHIKRRDDFQVTASPEARSKVLERVNEANGKWVVAAIPGPAGT